MSLKMLARIKGESYLCVGNGVYVLVDFLSLAFTFAAALVGVPPISSLLYLSISTPIHDIFGKVFQVAQQCPQSLGRSTWQDSLGPKEIIQEKSRKLHWKW
jgi:hypothetical protein